MEFRANFFAKIASQVTWVVFVLLVLAVVFRNTNSIAGWTRGDVTVLAGMAFIMSAVTTMFTFSLTELPSQVRSGTLDFVVTKPIDSQFWVSSRRFNFDQIGVVIAGITMVTIGANQAHIPFAADRLFGFGAAGLESIVIFYSFNFALMTTGIWLVRVDNLWILSESMVSVSRYPIDIYSVKVQRVLTYGLPFAFLSTMPTRQLVRGFSGSMLLIGLFWAIFALSFSRLFWRYAMTQYSSASS